MMMTIEQAKKAGVPLIDPAVYRGSNYADLPNGVFHDSPYLITTDKQCIDAHVLYCLKHGKLDLNNVLMRGSRGAMRYLNGSQDFAFNSIPKYHWPYLFAVRYLRFLDKKINEGEYVLNIKIKNSSRCESGRLTSVIFGLFAERENLFGNSISTGKARITQEKTFENRFLNRMNKFMCVLVPGGRLYCFEGRTERYLAVEKLCQELKKCE